MADIKINFVITDDEEERIKKLIPILNSYGSPDPTSCKDWTIESVVEFLLFLKTSGTIEDQLTNLEETYKDDLI